MEPNNTTPAYTNYQDSGTILTRKRITIVIVVAFLLIALWFILSIINSGHIEITGRSDIPKNSTASVEVVMPPGQKSIKLNLKAGEVKKLAIKKGTYRINASAGNLKSVDVVNVRGLKTTKITTPKGEQHAIHKLGSNAQYCPIIIGGQVYSYGCGGDGPIYKHEKLNSNTLDPRIPMFDNATFSSLAPVQDGLVGLLSSAEVDSTVDIVAFANLKTNTLQRITLSGEAQDKLVKERPVIIASDDPDKPYFLMVFNKGGAAYLFQSINDSEPVKLALPQNASLRDNFGITTFNFFGDHIVTYAGRGDTVEDPLESDEEGAKPAPVSDYDNSIYEFDFEGKVVKTIDLPNDFSATDAYKVNDSFYAIQQNDGLELYHYKDNKLRKIYSILEGTQPLALGNKVYVAASGGTLYAFHGNTDGSFSLESVFSSSNIKVLGLFRSPNGLMFTGNVTRSDVPFTDIYQLLDSKQTTPPIEDAIDFTELDGIATSYDYDDSTIIFSLSSTGSGADYETLRSRMAQKIKDMGMDVGSRRVELYPLN